MELTLCRSFNRIAFLIFIEYNYYILKTLLDECLMTFRWMLIYFKLLLISCIEDSIRRMSYDISQDVDVMEP